ncbi:oxygen-independent coproporphyrinogen III oxidase [Sneathiella marina]|uniref:Coproporphyrinogen-III oxidase n=1 Tax=Sneathiella marina TaxID=2950108 RepID=A0ABY4VZR6_9PROT|nr:oxygen-independent coproporphyrinogen III oxidase [Sneathiella marina]USG60425.1 oxygen-independent coproporphyrinogen III oxidase [Sneathiella marina]
MTAALKKRLAQSVPRYTSYPTAPHFSPAIDARIYRQWLSELDPNTPLSIYVHVPFCRKMCWYCGCHTKVTAKYDPIAAYVDAMRTEIGLLASALPGKFSISHIHWGGGTPTILSPTDFGNIMRLFEDHFDFTDTAEKAIEIDPRTLDAPMIEALATAGINRASLGVQDFSPIVQNAINRVQPFETTKAVTEDLRRAGISNINFDLMYGLPLQSEADVRHTVDLAHSLSPDRIALFGYAHVPWMKSHMKMIQDQDLPDGPQRLAQATAAADRLTSLGYQKIGLDHFATEKDDLTTVREEGTLSRNFQGYTTDNAETLIGIGASSIGSLPGGYVQNVVPMHAYEETVQNGEFPVSKGIELNLSDKVRRHIIERLMCDLEVDLNSVSRLYQIPVSEFREELSELSEFENEGLVDITFNRLKVTDTGRLFVRTICSVFDQYLNQGLARHSKAV